jgi:hypothetical protein
MEYRDVRVKSLFGIFSYFEMCFLDKESICTPDQKCISVVVQLILASTAASEH